MDETVGGRTAVPSTWQAIPGNPNCYVTQHATVANGALCKADRDCPDKRCRMFPDGDKYCLAERKACTLPGGDGAPGGAVIATHQQCYECAAGAGWKLCGEGRERGAGGAREGGGGVRRASGCSTATRTAWSPASRRTRRAGRAGGNGSP